MNSDNPLIYLTRGEFQTTILFDHNKKNGEYDPSKYIENGME